MTVITCPVCETAVVDPEPEWLDTRTEIEELCEACADELHGGDDSRWP